MLPGYRKPKQHEIEACSQYLDKEIEIINPAVLIPLGYYATKYIFSKYDISIPEKLEFDNVYSKLSFLDSKKVFPLRHPAAVLHNYSIKEELIKNYRKLKVLLYDCK